MTAPYSEDQHVQATTADYLRDKLGWESVYAHNNEDFGPASLLGRNSDREVVLTRSLRTKLQQINPGLPEAAYAEAIRQITATVASQSLTATNREKYNREKDRVTIEKSFEALLRLAQELDEESQRAVREGLDEESLAIFDLLMKPELTSKEISRIKSVATTLLQTLKEEKLRVDHWRDKEATRDAVRQAIHDFLWSDDTGLPVDCYDEQEVEQRADEVYRHVFRAYPQIPSPFYQGSAVA